MIGLTDLDTTIWTALAGTVAVFSLWFGGSLVVSLLSGDRECRTWECPICLTFLSAVLALCGKVIYVAWF